jgi:DNA polymerase III subunit chi
MPELAFHTGIADKLGYACRLLRKACRQGARVVVRADATELARLDPMLWTFEPLEFVPHLRLRPGQTLDAALQRTPIWLVDPGVEAPRAPVLVNLGPQAVEVLEFHERVIELVGIEEAERQAGRLRWREHQRRGYIISHVTPVGAT